MAKVKLGSIWVMGSPIRVLMITSEWPTEERPDYAPFIVRQANFLRSAGLRVDVFPFRGSKKPFNYLRAWFQIRKKLRRGSYDLVHAQWGQSGLLAIPKYCPLVVTFRGSDLEGIVDSKGQYTFAGNVLKFLSKAIALVADEIIVLSESLGSRLPKGCKYHLIPSGLDLGLFCPTSKMKAREALALDENRRLVLFGGRPEVPVKRYNLAQQALALLAGQWNIDLVVCQKVPHHVMPLYMNACDVLLLTSLHEGSPDIIKEALACNLPIVSVDVGDVRERISGISGCILCNDDRPTTIAAGLVEVLSRKMPINSRDAVKDLDEGVLTKEVIGVYHHAMQRWVKSPN
jgi:glycosyltransferase involved in cell wall biosynthesis